jgi:hypothetical protein
MLGTIVRRVAQLSSAKLSSAEKSKHWQLKLPNAELRESKNKAPTATPVHQVGD